MRHEFITPPPPSATVQRRQDAAVAFQAPIVQCLAFRLIPTDSGYEVYRAALSDGQHWIQCLLPPRASSVEIARQGQIVVGCVCRLTQYHLAVLHNRGYVSSHAVRGENRKLTSLRSVLVVRDLEVLHSLGVPEKIGQPIAAPPPVAEPENPDHHTETEELNEPKKPPIPPQVRAGSLIYPVEALSPFSREWTIKVQVTSKSNISKPMGNSRDVQKGFNVNLRDDTGEIRATYSGQRCSEFHDLLQEGSTYYISSPCNVSLVEQRFTFCPDDFELVFNTDTTIESVED